jgi:group I intron endonuclease
MSKICGIYKIESKIKPERYYIGSAIDINVRWKVHLNSLKKNTHHNRKLQNHYNKYGKSDLQFSVLVECDKEDLLKTEQSFLDSKKPYFNICVVAGSQLNRHWKLSIDKKIKLKENWKNRKPLSKTKQKTKIRKMKKTIKNNRKLVNKGFLTKYNCLI